MIAAYQGFLPLQLKNLSLTNTEVFCKQWLAGGFVPGLKQTFSFVLPPLSEIYDVVIRTCEHRASFSFAF